MNTTMQQQPALAPAPHQMRPAPQATSTNPEELLRDQLLNHVRESSQAQQQAPHAHLGAQRPQTSSPPGHANLAQNIDPAIAGPGMMTHSPGESGGEDSAMADARRAGKRELSTSKRAAQNRAAQRAFRQRKEGHIKKLEEQVRDYQLLSDNFKAIQAENYQLRDYIISLQSRLIEAQGDLPPAPSGVSLLQPTRHHGLPMSSSEAGGAVATSMPTGPASAPTAPMMGSALSQLQAVAAVAELSKEEAGEGR